MRRTICLYEYLIKQCSIYKDAVDQQEKVHQYIDYANARGFFFRGTLIDFFVVNILCKPRYRVEPEELHLRNKLAQYNFEIFRAHGLLETEVQFEQILQEFTVESQLQLVDFAAKESIVIGCPRGLEDKSLINHDHGCTQAHRQDSLLLDYSGYAHNADVIGFDALLLDNLGCRVSLPRREKS
jgi:hypothetical protein